MNKLPHPIATYVAAANAFDAQGVAECFNLDATVFDEGHTHRGRTEIAAWTQETSERYRATMEAIGMEEAEGEHRMRAKVRGNFPGSPIALTFRFRLQDDGIQSLEVTQ